MKETVGKRDKRKNESFPCSEKKRTSRKDMGHSRSIAEEKRSFRRRYAAAAAPLKQNGYQSNPRETNPEVDRLREDTVGKQYRKNEESPDRRQRGSEFRVTVEGREALLEGSRRQEPVRAIEVSRSRLD